MYLHFAVRTLQIQLNFVSKIVLTKCEKCLSDQEFFLKVQGWRPRIWKIFEITRTLYSNSERSKQSLKQDSFFTYSWRCLRSNALKLEKKMLAFRNLQVNIFWGPVSGFLKIMYTIYFWKTFSFILQKIKQKLNRTEGNKSAPLQARMQSDCVDYSHTLHNSPVSILSLWI